MALKCHCRVRSGLGCAGLFLRSSLCPGEYIMTAAMLGRTATMRLVALLVLLALMGTGIGLLFGTSSGSLLLHHPHQFGTVVRTEVADHPITTPITFVAVYV